MKEVPRIPEILLNQKIHRNGYSRIHYNIFQIIASERSIIYNRRCLCETAEMTCECLEVSTSIAVKRKYLFVSFEISYSK